MRGWTLNLVLAIFLAGILPCCADQPEPTAGAAVAAPQRPGVRLKFSTGIRSILEDSQGNTWFGSHGEGVARYDGQGMTYYTVADGLTSNQVRSIYEDPTGVVWFEGGKGLSSFDGAAITPRTDRDYHHQQEWSAVAGDLWFKGDEAIGYSAREEVPGVYRYDGERLTYHAFPPVRVGSQGSSLSASTPFVAGRDGTVWLGTYGAVIGYHGGGDDDFTVIDDAFLGLNAETGYLHVRSLFEDSRGNLWIGNNGIGVFRYDGDTAVHFSATEGLLSNERKWNGGHRSPPNTLEHVFAIGEDLRGNMWFGDRDTGAWRYDGRSMTNFTARDGLTTPHIWRIYNSRDGGLWFALDDGSVVEFDGEAFQRIF